MALYFSPSTVGFYDASISLTIPADAVGVTSAAYASLMAAQSAGQVIVVGVGGAPVAQAAPAPPAPTLAQLAAAAMSAGLTVTSTSNPALNGTYACDATAQQHMMAEMISLTVSATFADGTALIIWPNITGSFHSYTPEQFKPLALAIGAYVSALYKCVSGVLTALPAASVTIP